MRCVGGYCIAKCKYHMSCRIRNSLFAPGMEKEICKRSKQLTLLDEMTTSSTEIYINTKYEKTLIETLRKQNTCERLTNMKDSLFEFFEMVEQRARYIMTQETLVRENKHMYRYTLNEIISDESILETFMINDMESDCISS